MAGLRPILLKAVGVSGSGSRPLDLPRGALAFEGGPFLFALPFISIPRAVNLHFRWRKDKTGRRSQATRVLAVNQD
jgi:hypothetical protein